jgi:hypothetical protein
MLPHILWPENDLHFLFLSCNVTPIVNLPHLKSRTSNLSILIPPDDFWKIYFPEKFVTKILFHSFLDTQEGHELDINLPLQYNNSLAFLKPGRVVLIHADKNVENNIVPTESCWNSKDEIYFSGNLGVFLFLFLPRNGSLAFCIQRVYSCQSTLFFTALLY